MKIPLLSIDKLTYLTIAFLLFNLLVNNHQVSLWDEDEAAYAGFGTQMLQSGDWVNPTFKYSTIHRKTPLHFWTITASFAVFGANEFALRLPSVLAILLSCWLVFALGKPIFGVLNAKRAALILSSSILLPMMAKIAFTDATLLCFSTLSVLSLFNYLYQPNWRWNVGLWIGVALGILTKGPPIIILLGGIWVLLAIFHPKRKNLMGTHPWFYGVLALLPFAAWCYASYSQDYALWEQSGSLLSFAAWWQLEFEDKKIHLLPFLWDWYVLRRIGGEVLGQGGFWGYHWVVLTVAFLTWLPFWFSAWGGLFSHIKRPTDKQLLLLIWLAIGWLFWELMSSKLPSYSMAAQPALALAIALFIEKIEEKKTWDWGQKIGFGLFLFIFSSVATGLPIASYLLLGDFTIWYTIPVSVMVFVLLYNVWIARKQTVYLFQNLVLFGLGFMAAVWLFVAPMIERTPIKSFDDVVQQSVQLAEGKTTQFALCGLDRKQLKISLFVYGQQAFGAVKEWTLEEALKAYESPAAVIIVLGTEQFSNFEEAFAQKKRTFAPQRIEHWSTDDELKAHPFYIISNIDK